jgi:prepilin-type processing-associated H-X9-DG protein
VRWADGRECVLAAVTLRRACRCAHCTASRARGEPVVAASDIAITAIAAVGGYGVNITFSDGHARGIFPWSLLHSIASIPIDV